MARIPTALESGIGSVDLAGLPSPATPNQNLNAPIEAFGGGRANKAAQLGDATNDLSAIAWKQRQENDAIEAAELDSKAQREVLNLMYDSNNGLFARKGGLAMGVSVDAQKNLEDIKTRYLDQASSPGVRTMLHKSLTSLENSTFEASKRYEFKEGQDYKADIIKSRQQLNNEAVALNWNDDEEFNKRWEDQKSAVVAEGKIAGLSPDALNLRLSDARSKMLGARVISMIETDNEDNIVKAGKLYDQARESGQINFEETQKLDRMIDAVRPKAMAKQALNELKAPPDLGSIDRKEIFDKAIIGTESQDRQFDKNGQPLTSKAGAIGAAQVMPDTAKWTAEKLMKQPFDEQRYKNDAEYNKAIGRTYFDYLNTKFENTTLAVLAYNWGEGNMQSHIDKVGDPRTGQVTMSKFLATVPSSEARGYVPKVLKALGASSGKIPPELAEMKAAELDLATPGAGDELRELAQKNNTAIDNQEKEYALDVKTKLAAKVAQNNGDWTTLSAWERAEAQRVGVWDDVTRFKGVSDPNVSLELAGMDPDQLAGVDIREYSGKLSITDQESWAKKIQDLKEKPEFRGEYRTNKELIKDYTTALKIKGQDELKFVNRIEDAASDFKIKNGRSPNRDELKTIVDTLVLSTGTIFGGKVYQKSRQDQYDVEDIPQTQLFGATSSLKALGYEINNQNLDSFREDPSKFIQLAGVDSKMVNQAVSLLISRRYPVNKQTVQRLVDAYQKGDNQ
jgi:soluble lytic murein transglycosylase